MASRMMRATCSGAGSIMRPRLGDSSGSTTHIRMYAGTTAYEFPVVASVLFDDAGLARGERLVTDPRQQVPARDRKEFWVLADFIRQRFDYSTAQHNDFRVEEVDRVGHRNSHVFGRLLHHAIHELVAAANCFPRR